MIYAFPHETALLPRTKLAYANLPGILSDGKRDRQGRLAGFVLVQLGERAFLVFLRGGEAFFAARMTPRERGQAALSEVLRLAGTESERGEAGHIGFFAAPEEQLLAMLSTLAQEPLPPGEGVEPLQPERLFPSLRERAFTGVLELSAPDGAHHYLLFRGGGIQHGWFAGRDEAVPVPTFLRGLFETAGMRAALYPALASLPVQAGPGLVDLYRRLIGGTMRELATAAGRDSALALMARAQVSAARESPVVAAFVLTAEGRVSGDPLGSPAALTEGVARWLTGALAEAADRHAVDPGTLLERVGHDSRFVLQEHGFLAHVPWALAL
jgi:hypothetical protein